MFLLDDLRFGKPGAEENFVEYLKTTCSIDNVFECIEVCIAQLTRKIVNSLQNNYPYMHEVGILYALIDELSPVEGSFYWLLQSLTDMYAVPINILPSHFQFLINDPQFCGQNAHMNGLQQIFRENLMQNRKMERSDFRSHLEFKAQPQLILFIHILNFAQYYKIPTLEFSKLTTDVLNTVKGKLKRKFPNDLMLNYMIANPYVVIIRRMLFHLTNEVIKYRGIDASKKPEKLSLLQQYVILIQESVLYSPIMQRYPEELKFTSQQSRLLHTHQSKSKKETDICLIYILLILNNQYGIKLETLLATSNFLPERKQYKPQNINFERTFFFDAGRQQYILDFHQVLYRYLNDALLNYQFESKSSDFSILPILNTYLLFLRWQYAKYELTLINISQLSDNCLHQYAQKYYKIQKERQVIVNQKPAFSINGLINIAVSQVKRTLQRVLKNQDNDKYRILKQYKIKDEDLFEFDFRNQLDLKIQIDLIQEPLQYFEKELESQKVSKAQSARLIYPFYTYTANKIVDVLLQQQGQKEDVQQAILNFTYFFYSQHYDYLFNGIIPRSIKADDIKRSSDKFYKISEYDRFLLGEHYNYDKFIRIIEQSKLNKLTKEKAISFYRAINSKSSNITGKNEDNSSITNQTSRLYVKPKQYQPWQVPQRTNEFLFLLFIARILSFALDKVTFKKSSFEVPQTSWPRLLSGYTGLLIFILSLIYILKYINFI